MKRWLMWMMTMIAVGGLYAAAKTGPGAYVFANPEAKDHWRTAVTLPEDCAEISPTCLYSPSAKTVYLLTEFSGLAEGYETEFVILGPLSDRSYEGLVMAFDAPSVVARAVQALGVTPGVAADPSRGLAMAQGERFTVSLCRLKEAQRGFLPLSDFMTDTFSTPAQNLLGRGFPFVGGERFDDLMPAAIMTAYTERASTFGLPFHAPKGNAYGSFCAKTTEEAGALAVVALKWEQLPGAVARVHHAQLRLTAETVAQPEKLIAQLKAFCEDPRDIFLQVTFDETLTVGEIAPLANLLLALEQEGGFTLAAPEGGYLPLRAFAPQAAWRIRENRVFQPWEMEFHLEHPGAAAKVSLCQILEDWMVEGNDPALTRKCYPGMTPQNVLNVMKQVDVNDGKIYVVFFYCPPTLPIGSLLPYARALAGACPTQWLFLEAPEPAPAPRAEAVAP